MAIYSFPLRKEFDLFFLYLHKCLIILIYLNYLLMLDG